MSDHDVDNGTAIRYLLGELSDEERRGWEERMFADVELFVTTEAAEYDLIDQYVRGRLESGAREKFERRLMASESQRARVHAAHALTAQLASSESARPHTKRPVGRIVGIFASAAAIIVVAVWWGYTTDRQEPLSTSQRASVETSAPPDRESSAAAAPRVFAVVLEPGLTRTATNEAAPSAVPRDAESVRLELHLVRDLYARYDVVVSTPEGRDVWRALGVEASLADGIPILATVVPSAIVPDGDYSVRAHGVDGEGRRHLTDAYSLRIARR